MEVVEFGDRLQKAAAIDESRVCSECGSRLRVTEPDLYRYAQYGIFWKAAFDCLVCDTGMYVETKLPDTFVMSLPTRGQVARRQRWRAFVRAFQALYRKVRPVRKRRAIFKTAFSTDEPLTEREKWIVAVCVCSVPYVGGGLFYLFVQLFRYSQWMAFLLVNAAALGIYWGAVRRGRSDSGK